jgi:alkanesulfonate monooxygenase SsuD/methylene tetrahydromethanopterin reductase-like flavin-dependent oxidoreductase (luciferase family)
MEARHCNAKIMTGTGDEVVEKLNAWQLRLGADELMVLNLGHSPAAMRRSTEIIADTYGMPDHGPAAPPGRGAELMDPTVANA